MDEALIVKYGGPVPRYTSYPTAVQFHAGVDGATVEEWLGQVRGVEASVYFHMAYCKALCLYCGCNMKVTHHAGTITRYTDAVLEEMRRVERRLPERPVAGTIHFGGGTPSYVPEADLVRIMMAVREMFVVRHGAEISMEIDPRQLPDSLPAVLGRLGFNRVSLGIQDTNPDVQKIIRRVQPHAMNLRAVELLRAAGIEGINIDLLYGLPGQTTATLLQTITDVLELRPTRIALFGYAHVPWMKKHQVVLEGYGIPGPTERLEMFGAAASALVRAGYVAVGIDHFCLPSDPMAVALGHGELGRNFMGYTTDDARVMLGFGASAISQHMQGYAQNITDIGDYLLAMEKEGLPVGRGIATTPEDGVRRGVIERLLCDMRVEGDGIESLIVQPETLRGMVLDGLVQWRGRGLQVTDKGRPFVRAVARCFDAYGVQGGRHSQI